MVDESFEEFKNKLENQFNNTVELKIEDFDTENYFYKQVRDIYLHDNILEVDHRQIKLPHDRIIIVVNGNVENVKSETKTDLFIGGDVNNVIVDNLKCGDIYSDVNATNITCKDIEGNVKTNKLTCNDVIGGNVTIKFKEETESENNIKINDIENSLTIESKIENTININVNAVNDIRCENTKITTKEVYGDIICNYSYVDIMGDFYNHISGKTISLKTREVHGDVKVQKLDKNK